MPGLLYLETNYLLGVAEGRCPPMLASCDRDGLGPALAIPSMCILEAYSALEELRKRSAAFARTLDERINQAKRDRTSPDARILLGNLMESRAGILRRSSEVERRLEAAIDELADRAELIESGASVVRSARDSRLVEKDPTDNLILHCILHHARSSPIRGKGFLSENTNDFTAGAARGALRAAGVRYFSSHDGALGWLGSLHRRGH